MLSLFVFLACLPSPLPQDPQEEGIEQPVSLHFSDLKTNISMPPHEEDGGCYPGREITLDLQSDPKGLTVEILYGYAGWLDAPYDLDGASLFFRCGEVDDPAYKEPQVNGAWAGPVERWRVSWLSAA